MLNIVINDLQTSNAGPKLESCVLAANIYIVLVQIPGEKNILIIFADDY